MGNKGGRKGEKVMYPTPKKNKKLFLPEKDSRQSPQGNHHKRGVTLEIETETDKNNSDTNDNVYTL